MFMEQLLGARAHRFRKKDKVLVLKKCMVWWHLTYITEKIFLRVQRVFGLKPPEIYFGLERCGLMSWLCRFLVEFNTSLAAWVSL